MECNCKFWSRGKKADRKMQVMTLLLPQFIISLARSLSFSLSTDWNFIFVKIFLNSQHVLCASSMYLIFKMLVHFPLSRRWGKKVIMCVITHLCDFGLRLPRQIDPFDFQMMIAIADEHAYLCTNQSFETIIEAVNYVLMPTLCWTGQQQRLQPIEMSID